MKREMWVKGTGLWCALVEYVKDNYNARFHDPRNHRYRERHFTILLDINSLSRTITIQGFMVLAFIGTEKDTLVF